MDTIEQTLVERPPAPGESVRYLVEVLGYDDLLADRSRTHALEGDCAVLGRATERTAAGPDAIRVTDRWMSGRHAVIERRGDEDWLCDQGSRNGSFVNGQPVKEIRLGDRDLIEIGHTLFVYRHTLANRVLSLAAGQEALRVGPSRTLCAEMGVLLGDLRRIAPTRDSVLILGETGVGKEVIARLVHEQSGRGGAFRALDGGAIPDSLFEAVLFGSRKGAFTGAVDQEGEAMRADHGTLLLDEVGNLSAAAQAKLLRVLETGHVVPLGAAVGRDVDVRWLAATNRDIGDESAFRPDLLRRLAGFFAHIPPLRARREDLGSLAAYILRETGIERASISVGAARALFTHPLPGNIRQLRSVLRAAAHLAKDGAIESVAVEVAGGTSASDDQPSGKRRPPPSHAELEQALAATQGNVVQTAKLLGTNPKQVYRWTERYGLTVEKYRG